MATKKLLSGIALESNPEFADLTLKEGETPVNPYDYFPEGHSDLETSIVDQHEILKEIASVEKKIDKTIVIKDSLNDVTDIIKDSVDDGGLKESSAALLEVLTNSAKDVEVEIDEENKSRPLPSTEHYNFVRERQKNTKLALESIKTKLENTWKWFIKLLKELVIKIKTYIDRNKMMLNLLSMKIKKLEHRLDGRSTSNPIREFKDNVLETQLSINGRFPRYDLVKHYEELSSVFIDVLEYRSSNRIRAIGEQFKDIVNNETLTKEIIDTIYVPPTSVNFKKNVVSSFETVSSNVLFGNRVLSFIAPGKVSDDLVQFNANIGSFGMKLDYKEISLKPTGVIKIVSLREQRQLLEISKNIIEKFINYKNDIVVILIEIDKLINFANTRASLFNDKADKNSELNRNTISNIAATMPKILYKPILQFGNYTSGVVSHILRYVDISTREKQASK